MDFRELHKIRIKNEYLRLSEMESGGLFTWEAVKGEPPYVEEYLFHIRVPGYISPDEHNDEWTVKVRLLGDYPRSHPQVKIVDSKKIFHPNWWIDGRWGGLAYSSKDSLVDFIMKLLHDMAYDPAYVNCYSSCNYNATKWYLDPSNQHLFPTIYVDNYVTMLGRDMGFSFIRGKNEKTK